MIGWEQVELARRSRVAIGTVRRMESFDGEIGSRTTTLSQVQATLEKAGIHFLYDGGPGVQLRAVTQMSKTPRKARRFLSDIDFIACPLSVASWVRRPTPCP